MADHLAPRVNSARLPDYITRTVRLTGKIVREKSDISRGEMIMVASDGGEVIIKFQAALARDLSDYVEIIGNVTANDSMKAHAMINMGDALDLDIVNFTVEKWHDPKFQHVV